ncbi:MAG: hypothetical protein AAGG01_17140, partial [Planctomycetota bacterium]
MPEKIPAKRPDEPLDALIEHICDQLVGPLSKEPSSLGRSVFAKKLRRAILAPVLSEAEQQLIEKLSAGSGSIDDLLTLRIKKAIREACDESGLNHSDVARELMGAVRVARGDGLDGGTQTHDLGGESLLTMTLAQDAPEGAREPVVLTNVGGKMELELTEATLAQPDEPETHKDGDPLANSLSFFEVTEALEAIEEHVMGIAPKESKQKLETVTRGEDLIGKTLNGKYQIESRLG